VPRKEKPPAFQWYPKDILSDGRVEPMSLECEGAYRRLLDYCWIEKRLPDDLDALASYCKHIAIEKMREMWTKIAPCFTRVEEDGAVFFVHPRLETERRKQAKNMRARKLAARARWGRERQPKPAAADANALHLECSSSSSSSATAVTVHTDSADGVASVTARPSDVRFERFWVAYPKKAGKAAAWRAWKKLHPSETLTDTMIAAVDAQRAQDQWRVEHGRFIPNPATWLNRGQWEDEVPSAREAAETCPRCGRPQAACRNQQDCTRYWLAAERAKREASIGVEEIR
jgi:uncharacterized protein YdaU (DUF1376 family)